MTIETEQLRHTAEVLDVLTSKLPENHPLRARSVQDAKNCVALIYSAADLIDAQAAEIAEAKGQIEHLDKQNEAYRKALLSGADGRAAMLAGMQEQAAEIERLRDVLLECQTLLSRTPKITRDIYIGNDRTAWGKRAEALHANVSAALSGEGK